MPDDIVIRMEHGWKRYGTTLSHEVKRRLGRLGRAQDERLNDDSGFWSLRDVTFEVARGEILGVIGRNGAGKSTLLKVLAGVSPLTRGHCALKGRVFTMIELNAGLHNDLTGRQNVMLLGAIMGFSQQEMQRRMREVQDFCELGDFFDMPVWTYSSGMVARLGFAVAVNVDADVLLVDEVLAVGDMPFQRKCFARMDALYRSGVSLVFVSHSLRMVERLCPRCLYLDGGKMAGYGVTAEVITQYQIDTSADLLKQRVAQSTQPTAQAQAATEGHVLHVREVELVDAAGQVTRDFQTGDPLTIRVHYDSEVEAAEPIFGFGIMQETTYVTGFTNELHNHGSALRHGGGVFECRLPRLMLLSGVFSLSIKVRSADGGTLGGAANAVYFSVHTPSELRRSYEYGYVMTDVQWSTRASTPGIHATPSAACETPRLA